MMQCPECEEYVEMAYIQTETGIHNKEVYKCPKCKYRWKKRAGRRG